jgi:hypothetical protein
MSGLLLLDVLADVPIDESNRANLVYRVVC